MSDAYLDQVAGELADLALADEKRSGDEKIVPEIAEILGSSSQTLQEGFLTAVRVRRAEERARAILAERANEQVVEDTPLFEKDEVAPKPAAPEEPKRANLGGKADPKPRREEKSSRIDLDSVEDAAFEEVDPDAPLKQRATPKSGVSPVRPQRGG